MRLAIFALAAASAFAQQPSFDNARLESRAAGANLEPTLRAFISSQSSPAWIGYSVPVVPGERQVCGWDNNYRPSQRMSLEGPTLLYVMYRVEANQLTKVRIATPDCQIDAGGTQVVWLTGVNPDQSVAYLLNLVGGAVDRNLDTAISAIALHNTPAADRALDAIAASNRPESLRKKAVFWMGVARGRAGYEKLIAIVGSDASDKIREHAIFALSQSKEKDAVQAIVKTARQDKSSRVRGQALFWLAQKAGRQVRAADAIADAIQNDPETEVKRKAVFALTQLPNGEGVPKLIEVAKANRNPEVRKQAMFWLGQSKDPRALDFIESVLKR